MVVHGQDIRRPLGLESTVPEETIEFTLSHIKNGTTREDYRARCGAWVPTSSTTRAEPLQCASRLPEPESRAMLAFVAEHLLDRVREIALALPEVNERLSQGAPCFFLRDRRPICHFHDEEFAAGGRASLWCPAPVGVREELAAAVDWDEIAAIIEDA